MTYGHIRNIYGLELGTADVAYCSNVVSGILLFKVSIFRDLLLHL